MRTTVWIDVDGQDLTATLEPVLISGRVSDKAGGASATCELELSDADGRLLLPATGALLKVSVAIHPATPALIFTGKVDKLRSKGDRSGGRILTVSAKEIDAGGKVKETQSRHFDGKTVKEILTESGKAAGVGEIRIDEALGAITLPYAAQVDESFLAFGRRLAAEIGATFKVTDTRATFTARNGGGMTFPAIRAEWGRNLLDWDVAPTVGRPRFGKTKARWYDPKAATTREAEVETGIAGASAESSDRFAAPDEEAAKRQAGSAKSESEREAGDGTVRILGCVEAQPEATVTLIGLRPGVDGAYVIDGLDHEFSRDGFETELAIKKPGGSAGTDSRGAAAS